MSGLEWSGQRWLVYRGTPEQPGKLYWSCTDEAKAKQIVSDLVKLGITAFYVAPEQNHAQMSEELSTQPRYGIGAYALLLRPIDPLPTHALVSIVAAMRFSGTSWRYHVRAVDAPYVGMVVPASEAELATPIEALLYPSSTPDHAVGD